MSAGPTQNCGRRGSDHSRRIWPWSSVLGLLLLAVVNLLAGGILAQNDTEVLIPSDIDSFPVSTLEILLEFFEKTGGYRWNNRTNWLKDDISFCTWYGITCYDPNELGGARSNHIQKIDLSENHLQGTVPQIIFALPYIQSLTLRDNSDLVIGFEDIGLSDYLNELVISNTDIQTLQYIDKAVDLNFLHITDCKLGSTLPSELFNLRQLQGLYANYNAFTGTLPTQIGLLTDLTELYLFENSMTGQIPSEIGKLTDLKILALAENAFGGTLPNELNWLSSLEILAIQRAVGSEKGGGIGGSVIDFSNQTQLTEIYLSNQLLTGSIPDTFMEIAPADETVIADLSNNQLTGIVPASLGRFTRLSLLISGNKFTNISLSLCNITDWNAGDVGRFQCDGIMCGIGEFAPNVGRATTGTECQKCPSAKYMGTSFCEASEKNQTEILLAFYDDMNGPNWKETDGWNVDTDKCTWTGIECNNTNVTMIQLSNNQLQGTVPSDIFFSTLQVLDLSMNNIDFSFDGIKNSPELHSLAMYGTGLSSLDDIDQLGDTKIQQLILSSNNLDMVIPNDIFTLSTLTYIALSYNNFHGPVPTEVGNLPNLQRFHAYGNDLTGQMPTEFGMLKDTLEELVLSENDFTGTIPTELNSMSVLTEFSAHQTTNTKGGITGQLPSFDNCAVLNTLHLASNALGGALPQDLLKNSDILGNPIDIDLSHNDLTGSIPTDWVRFGVLSIDLSENQINSVPQEICGMAKWQGGDAGLNCQAILCPAGTFNDYGMWDSINPCNQCNEQKFALFMGSTKCSDSDVLSQSEILEKLYYSTGGPQWADHDGWTVSPDICIDWHGITCEEGKVVKIDLSSNNLTGQLTSDLFKLSSLRELDLEGNLINFTFDGIENATNLEQLYLSDNGLTSIAGVGKATNLKILHVTNNDIFGTLPDELFSLSNLEELYMNYNRFTGRLPPEIANLGNLEELFLLHNQLSGQIPASIGFLKKLRVLALTENNFGGTLPPELNDMESIEILAIQREGDAVQAGTDPGQSTKSGAGITGPLLSFNKLSNLKELYLGSNSLTGSIPYGFLDGISDISQGITIDLISNVITGEVPAFLVRFENMTIYLAGNEISGIADGLCRNEDWMNGQVSSYECNAILCPPNSYSEFGRQADSNTSCTSCENDTVTKYYGSFECASDNETQTLDERQILKDLFTALNGASWLSMDNWMDSDISFCKWKGITCVSPTIESVQTIQLSNNRLAGTVPTSVFNLTNLEELDLAGNAIHFNFDGIGAASELRYLNLDSTGLTTMDGIEDAINLALLHVMFNKFPNGTIPRKVFSLENLRVLYLSDNQFNESIPTDLQTLSKLLYFQCNNCGLTGAIPSFIGDLSSLQYLGLSGNSLRGEIPTSLELRSTLGHLDLSDQTSRDISAGITGSLPAFSELKKLQELYLNKNLLNGTIPDNFLQSVEGNATVKIDLRSNKLSGSVPMSVFSQFTTPIVLLAGNEFDELSVNNCTSYNWNNGDMQEFGCNGLMCNVGTYNLLGRETKGINCSKCDLARYYGSTVCEAVSYEKQILNSIYMNLGGADWANSEHWTEDVDICIWHGITCDPETKHVTIINLEGNRLVGSVPGEIFDLSDLTEIQMKRNAVVLSFAGIENATNLKTIQLSETGLTSLDGIGMGSSLTALHLTSNNIKTIPDELYNLSNLKDLFMNYNGIAGTLSPEVGKLTSLENFFLFHNNMTGSIPSSIGLLTEMQVLALGENKLTGTIPSEINQLNNLKVIALQRETGVSATGIGGSLMAKTSEQATMGFSGQLPAFDTLPKLRELYLGSNQLKGDIPDNFLKGIDDISAKIKVDLTLNYISGSIPDRLGEYPNMTVYLAGNTITDVPSSLCSIPSWMGGQLAVANGDCDLILCKPGTFNEYGRQASANLKCEPCPYTFTAEYYGSIACTNPETPKSAREILRAFYEDTGGSSWSKSTNWNNDDVSFCDWLGVSCDSDSGEVTELVLSSNNLIGTVPPVVFQLMSLRVLNLRGNTVSVEFYGIEFAAALEEVYLDSTRVISLDGIGKAAKLKFLYVQGNDFGAVAIPDELYSLTQLKHLKIADANIAGPLSSKIGDLKLLEEFYAHGNDMTGEIPTTIGELTNLRILVLSENLFVGNIPTEINQLVNLTTLSIDSFTRQTAGLSGTLPSFLGLPNLRAVNLNSNSFTGSIPTDLLSGLSNIDDEVNVRLMSNRLEGTIPGELQQFKKLNIDLADNLIVTIDPDLCKQDEWMNNKVEQFRCAAILCPSGTFNQLGRQTTEEDPCKACDGQENSKLLGATICPSEEKKIERETLTLFYNTCGGEQWKNKDKWLDPKVDICKWYGISCHTGGINVNSILLGSNNVINTPPKDLFKLRKLKWLWLYSNPIDFSFDGIGQAKELTSLLLDSTGLTSLDGIGEASQLTDLDVRFNNLVGPFPTNVTKLINLETLSMSDNALTGSIPSLERLKKLKSLRMAQNLFVGTLPTFSTLSELKSLDLSENKLSGAIDELFLQSADVGDTIFVDLSTNHLNGILPESLDRFQDLTLYLRDNMIQGIPPVLCTKNNWNDGDIGNFGCDGLLCAQGTFADSYGRESREGGPCTQCEEAKFFGQTQCVDVMASSAAGVNISTLALLLVVLVAFFT